MKLLELQCITLDIQLEKVLYLEDLIVTEKTEGKALVQKFLESNKYVKKI